jgi:hypothetical protein
MLYINVTIILEIFSDFEKVYPVHWRRGLVVSSMYAWEAMGSEIISCTGYRVAGLRSEKRKKINDRKYKYHVKDKDC